MSFLKQLLSPFVEFDENKARQQQNTTATSSATATPSIPSASAVTPAIPVFDENAKHPLITGNDTAVNTPTEVPTYSPSGTITEPLPEHRQYFEKLIDNANNTIATFQGTDFKEFVDSKVDIDDIQDEALKYKTAFNILKSTGLTKEKLFATGQEYLNIIGRDMNAFQGAHSLKYKQEVQAKEQLIQKKAEELQALTQKINALKADINKLTQENNITKDNLNTIKNSYLLAGENKQKEIQTELQKMAQYF